MASSEAFEIHSAARGPHWIAWVSRAGADQPYNSIVIIGETQAEAEGRARAWLDSPYNTQPAAIPTV